jgi:hypothetical protein
VVSKSAIAKILYHNPHSLFTVISLEVPLQYFYKIIYTYPVSYSILCNHFSLFFHLSLIPDFLSTAQVQQTKLEDGITRTKIHGALLK